MQKSELIGRLEDFPVIAAVQDNKYQAALESPVDIIFCLEPHLLTIRERTAQAHAAGKLIFVHLAMAVGIGQDKEGMRYLADCGVDGIITTRGQLIRYGKECGLLTVQRFFALDSRGIDSINELLDSASPDLIEIMPGVIGKIIRRFSSGKIPVIAGGLMETKAEVTEALRCGAAAISTSAKNLWYI